MLKIIFLNFILVLYLINQSQCTPIWAAFFPILKNLVEDKAILELNLSRSCHQQVEVIYDHADIFWDMFDASAKFPYSGMKDSGRIELGNFEQCVAIDYTFKDTHILGKYCYAGLVIPDISNITNTNLFYKLATCIPNGCSAEDMLLIADYIIPGFPPLFLEDFCTIRENKDNISLGTLITMCIFVILLFLLFFSTTYDVYCHVTNEKSFHPLLIAFSIVTNTKNILKVSLTPSPETIQVFSGFRTVSIGWIIAAHGVQAFTTRVIPAINMDRVDLLLNKRYASYLLGGNLAVTTFFFMSGFLMSFLYFKRKIDNWLVQIKNLPLLYMHRYIRLTVPLLMLYLLVVYVYKYLGNGPLWESGCDTYIGYCTKYWWSYFLYLQNYTNWDELCLIPLWYLSADMQLFLVAPLVLIPISRLLQSKNGLILTMYILAGMNLFFILAYLGLAIIFPLTNQTPFYTHSRFQEYFIGIMMGIFMRFTKDESYFSGINIKYFSKNCLNIIIWTIVLTAMFVAVLFYEDADIWFGYRNKTIYICFARVIWSIGLCWIVYSCYHGYGGIVNWILCRPMFQVIAKLTYSMYLLHFLVLGHFSLSNKTKFYIDNYVEFYLFCGYFIVSLVCSFLWTLVFESPILIIEKYFLNKRKDINFTNHVKKVEEYSP